MIRLSKHIADEMAGRRILLSYVEATVAAPDRETTDPTDVTLNRSFKAIPAFGNRVLRAVHRTSGDDVFAVTAHCDRGATQP
jgi:hypothetical protein